MPPDPTQFAHDRLAALARQRRREAELLPAISAASRRRLHEEVNRWRSGTATLRESGDPIPPWFERWRMALVWAAVGGAAAVLLGVVWFPGRDRPVATAQRSEESLSRLRSVQPSPPTSTTTRLASREDFAVPGPTPTAERSLLSAAASREAMPRASVSAGRRSAEGGPVGLDLGAAQRLRQQFQAVDGTGAPPSLLQVFDVVRAGDRVELHDLDGSVYTGRVAVLEVIGSPETPDSPAPVWSFEAKGYNRSLSQAVWITGNFGSDNPPGSPATMRQQVLPARLQGAAPKVDAFLGFPFSATVLVGGTNVVAVRATPVGP